MSEWRLAPSGERLAGRVIEAIGPLERSRGLLGRDGLAPGEGMWLKPCRQVHTMFMRFAIDVVFLDEGLKVVRVCRDMKPWRLSPLVWRARSCLELAAGAAAGVSPGQRLSMRAADRVPA